MLLLTFGRQTGIHSALKAAEDCPFKAGHVCVVQREPPGLLCCSICACVVVLPWTPTTEQVWQPSSPPAVWV